MFGSVGIQEIVLILVLALIVFGPRKLPEIGRNIGRIMADFRRATEDIKSTVEREINKIEEEEPPKLPPVNQDPGKGSAG